MLNKKKIKVFLDGADGIGWSIDADRKHIVDLINRSNAYKIVDSMNNADIIHNIWWNNILNTIPELINIKKSFFKRKPRVIVTCSNFIDPEALGFDLHNEFEKIKKIADAWICPGTKQEKILSNIGVKTFYFPFNVDHSLFKPQENISRQYICETFGIDYKVIENRVVIGSFQRDSLGIDLSKPKWQKNPDLLIELLKELPTDKFVLLLAGPRRQYVINQCKKYGIPYYYVGKERVDDDLIDNALPVEKMPFLYNLTDIYLITSKSEGGPKAVLEATATKTFIMSTNVGLASDFIDERVIFNDVNIYSEMLKDLVINYETQKIFIEQIVEKNYINFINILDETKMKSRLLEIYKNC